MGSMTGDRPGRACLILLALVGAWGCRARSPRDAAATVTATGAASSVGDPAFGPTIPNSMTPPGPAPSGMVWIPGGEFSMGGEATLADARPVHRVYVDGFWMDATEVTNAEFAAFVQATGYRTVAERRPRPEDVPDVPAEKLVAGSLVFTAPSQPVPLEASARWWSYIERASWRRPRGAEDRATGHERDPVVQVAYEDAEAYARWSGKRLPTEAEFELAARGGLAGRRYSWGDDFRPGGRFMANTFQGHFPDDDTAGDGWRGLAPVASFPPNGYGLYDITGNVWEWCSDWYRADTYAVLAAAGGVARNPIGPATSDDPDEQGVPKHVQRGGSFLCSSTYCTRYLVGSRGKGEVSTSTNHLGFRCVRPGR
jgi:formylglycine-generating enzyme